MILDVPYQSQEPLETTVDKKWCGLACLWMVISYYINDAAPSAEDLVSQYGEEFEKNGFQHKDLLKIARNFEIWGFRKSWLPPVEAERLIEKFQTEGEREADTDIWEALVIEESFFSIGRLLSQKIPVIASVSSEFSNSNSTHLVVIIGEEGENLIIHDPYTRGEDFKISKKEFRKHWLRQAVILYK